MWRNAACLALVALGLVHGVGYFAGAGPWRPLGFHFLVSPLPLVFNKAGPVETYARRFVVRVETRDGRTIELDDGRAVARALEGPFTRRKIHLELFLFWDTWEAPAGVLQRSFCRDGAVPREFGIEAPVAAVTAVVRSEYMRPSWERALRVGCPP